MTTKRHVGKTRERHNHRLQTNLWYHEEEHRTRTANQQQEHNLKQSGFPVKIYVVGAKKKSSTEKVQDFRYECIPGK